MVYLINVTHGEAKAVMFRTEDAGTFRQKVLEFKDQFNLNRLNSRVIKRPGMTIFSFPDTSSLKSWSTDEFYYKPDSIGKAFDEYGNLIV